MIIRTNNEDIKHIFEVLKEEGYILNSYNDKKGFFVMGKNDVEIEITEISRYNKEQQKIKQELEKRNKETRLKIIKDKKPNLKDTLMNCLNKLYVNDCLDDNTYNWIEQKIKEVV